MKTGTRAMMLLGIIADDFTGAADIAGFLVANGTSTTQIIGVPPDDLDVEAEAVVISLKSRSCPASQAVADSRAALAWLRNRNCRQFYLKYCSTFDSTAGGNIGPVTDALLDDLDDDFTVICPALPVNQRTVYNGYLFVNGVPLAESSMRFHPINPMTDSSLVRLMEAQAAGTCGVVTWETVERGEWEVRRALDEIRGAGRRYAVLDTLNTAHLDVLGRAVGDLTFVTGGSGLAAGMARSWAETGQLARRDPAETGQPTRRDSAETGQPARRDPADAGRPTGREAVVLAGSCSEMTRAQVSAYMAAAPARALDVGKCLDDPAYPHEISEWVLSVRGGRWAPIVYATADPETLRDIQERFGPEAGVAVEGTLAALAQLLAGEGFDRFIVAGGETAGAVVQALGITAFHVGPQISPGVPWVRAVDGSYSFALKSGNFGQEQFFFDCQEDIA